MLMTLTVEMGGTTLTADTDYELRSTSNGLKINILGIDGSGGVTGNVVITASGVRVTPPSTT